jgi:hypothetical protein
MLKKLTIENFDNFVKKTRRIAFETPFKLAKKLKLAKLATEEDIEQVISFKEVKLLILEQYSKEYNNDYVIIDNDYDNCSKILDSVISRLVNNELNKMASDGELECYFDSEINDFRFQIKKK